ncbi:MAG: DUF3341 domain-containing protein [Deltaproteobacteria bacterium]|nr:DUF3341 domain-containing protein [Deltaproteobacteria bacterium]
MKRTSTRGVLGSFFEPGEALAAVEKVRDSEWTHFDLLTPFPLHGIEEAMGQTRSWVPRVTAVLALLGIGLGFGFQAFVMAVDWPLTFGGKPLFPWPSFMPVTFEAMVFFAAIGSAVVAIVAGKRDTVPQPPPLEVPTGATVDRFVLWISATDPRFDAARVTAFVRALGAADVRLVDGKGGRDA